jgi:hypothetical protein
MTDPGPVVLAPGAGGSERHRTQDRSKLQEVEACAACRVAGGEDFLIICLFHSFCLSPIELTLEKIQFSLRLLWQTNVNIKVHVAA